MLIKRLDGKKESAEESSKEYKNAIEGTNSKKKIVERIFIQDCRF